MSDYTTGGVVPGPPTPVRLHVTECIISAGSARDRTWLCSRYDTAHLDAVHNGEPGQLATFGMPDLRDEEVRQGIRDSITAIMADDEETQQ